MTVPELKETTKGWSRFEQGPAGKNSHIPSSTDSGAEWVVLWDNDPKFYFASYPNKWGGSGWYADPQDVIAKPLKLFNVHEGKE